MSAPLTPHDCDLRDFPRMMIDIPRLRGSEFDATPDDAAWRAGFNLWMTAWHQVPAASLSSDDASMAKAAGLGRDLRTWKKIRTAALRGWIACDDGRLYHPVVAEIALESWLEKLQQRIASGSGNAKRWGSQFDPTAIEAEIVACAAMLAAINPSSKAIAKSQRRRRPEKVPPGPPEHPTGTDKPSHRDAKTIPPGSQETGTGTGNSSEDKSSAKIDIGDPDATTWRMVRLLLEERCGMSGEATGRFFGKLLADHGLEARDMLSAVAEANANATGDPKSMLVKWAQSRAKRRAEPQASLAEKTLRSNIQ